MLALGSTRLRLVLIVARALAMSNWREVLAGAALAGLIQTAAARADALEVKVGVLHAAHSRETVSILDIPPPDDFVAGARMAMDANNTTGKFLNQSFSIVDAKLGPDDDPISPLNDMLASGARFVIADLPADKLLAVADAARAKDALVFNAGAPDD